jgi:hypothetical protein
LSSSALPNGIAATMPCASAQQVPLSLAGREACKGAVPTRPGRPERTRAEALLALVTSAYLVLPQQALKAARASVRDMPLMRSIVRLDMNAEKALNHWEHW